MPFFQEVSYCIVPQPNLIGDGRCQNVGKYNTAGCSYDGGDCKEFNTIFSDCNAEYPFQMGDGICHIENNNTYCNYDGGDCLDFSSRFPNCTVDDTSLLGNRVCNGGMYNTPECGYDDRDCLGFNTRFPGCNVDIPLKVGNGVCNKGPYNTPECKYDNGDCDEFNLKHPECNSNSLYQGLKCTADQEDVDNLLELMIKLQKPQCVNRVNCTEWLSQTYPNCKVGYPPLIGDGVCQGGDFSGNTPECGYEDGDCAEFNYHFPKCNIYGAYKIGDGNCDGGGLLNTEECGYDGGDCIEFNTKYPNCVVELFEKIGDGRCDDGVGAYNTLDCGYDGGDCDAYNKYPNCNVNNPHWIGDGECHRDPYNTPECGYDDGDCDESNSKYNKCLGLVLHPYLLDNGQCNGGKYNTPECGYDGGDCIKFNKDYPKCRVKYPRYVEDGLCNRGSYNILECGYDGGDCHAFNTMYPNCTVSNPSLVGNGNCDGNTYNTLECGFDGGDCLICSLDNDNCRSTDVVLFIDGEKRDTKSSKRESQIIAMAQMITSIISLIASNTILWMIFRSKEKMSSIFHRLLFMLSLSDIMSSIALGLSTIPIPSEYKDIIWNARGNATTCQMQGFFIFIGSMAAPLYNCSLCWYYVFVVVFQKKDNYIKKKVEPFLHGIPIIFSLTGAITILVNGAFNANMSFCFIGTNHNWEDDLGENDCINSFDAKMLFTIFSAAPYIILPIVIIVTMGIMFRAVLEQEKTQKKYGAAVLRTNLSHVMNDDTTDRLESGLEGSYSGRRSVKQILTKATAMKRRVSIASSNNNNRWMSRIILNRALAYSFGFIFTYTLPMIISINTLLNKETGFLLSMLARVLFPLQGFFNFLIFIYPKILHAKRSNKNLSWFGAFLHALSSKNNNRRNNNNMSSSQQRSGVLRSKKRRRKDNNNNSHDDNRQQRLEDDGVGITTSIASSALLSNNFLHVDIAKRSSEFMAPKGIILNEIDI